MKGSFELISSNFLQTILLTGSQPPPIEGAASIVTLKGFLTKHYSPRRRRGRRVYCLICFPLRGRKTNNYKPCGDTVILFTLCYFYTPLLFSLPSRCMIFSFLASQQKRKHIFSLRTLRLESRRWRDENNERRTREKLLWENRKRSRKIRLI